jgi:phosphoglycerate dehydrogenase-like enzyme
MMPDSLSPKILVLLPASLYDRLFTPEADAELRSLGLVTYNQDGTDWDSGQLADRIADQRIVVTGWGSPAFDDAVLDAASCLEFAAHSAGSIKHLFPRRLFEEGVRVSHAAAAIAPAVAEMSLTLLLMLLRKPHQADRDLRAGRPWGETRDDAMGRELNGLRVGVVGAGYTGRCFIRMLRGMGAKVWTYDPYLTVDEAADLGVRPVELDELLRACPAISLQAPSTEETYHMIGERELSIIEDGTLLINTARSWLVDESALLRALELGRIRAALDVFDEEPLPDDHPLRSMENVVLSPHIAGASAQARMRQGQFVVDEIGRFLSGRDLRFEVTADMLDTMA